MMKKKRKILKLFKPNPSLKNEQWFADCFSQADVCFYHHSSDFTFAPYSGASMYLGILQSEVLTSLE
jgi:hypothetical protein